MTGLVSLLFDSKKGAQINELILDATLREEHTYTNRVTQYPIETGSDISDHIKLDPDKLVIEGFVTNSPVNQRNVKTIGQFAGSAIPGGQVLAGVVGTALNVGEAGLSAYRDFKRPDSSNQVESALKLLLEMSGRVIEGGRVDIDPKGIEIVCGLRNYTNMFMESLTIPRDAKTGQSMRFTANFIQIKSVATSVVDVPFPSDDVKKKSGNLSKNKEQVVVANDKKTIQAKESTLFKARTK